ncbi:phosphoribosylamine--glycine ligase [Roseomonas marmotae]|nr:phosphoribosylamine--glycine ligase [Roseomonas marmotae]
MFWMLLALLPAACATAPAAPERRPETPVESACRAEAQRDPAVLAVQRQSNPGNWVNEQRIGHEMRVAELRAFRDCMRRNGAPLRGGVEAVRPL